MKDFTESDLPSPGISGRIGNVEGRLFRDSGVVWERMYREQEFRAAIIEEREACANVAEIHAACKDVMGCQYYNIAAAIRSRGNRATT